jgi:hypothetical protein
MAERGVIDFADVIGTPTLMAEVVVGCPIVEGGSEDEGEAGLKSRTPYLEWNLKKKDQISRGNFC